MPKNVKDSKFSLFLELHLFLYHFKEIQIAVYDTQHQNNCSFETAGSAYILDFICFTQQADFGYPLVAPYSTWTSQVRIQMVVQLLRTVFSDI